MNELKEQIDWMIKNQIFKKWLMSKVTILIKGGK
jgi:hypothetical protein